ncbi:MAG TPA: HDOD domain-containing protein [Spongiibacteraceae bacterium]|nr:HDOD domain-containing protein [Spongiibacteraceae bacterium]
MEPDSRITLDRLPSLPQVLTKILDAVHSERADLQHIATIIRHDTAMATRLLGVANSSYYGRTKACQTVERALLLLGTDTVKTIVITAAIKQFFNRFNPHHRPFVKEFWRRSLVSANFAHILANLTNYNAPDEAYLCGLLMNVGQLILLNQHDRHYIDIWSKATDDEALLKAEREHFQRAHQDIGADLIDGWRLGGFMGDAVRFHHEASTQILDAHHLVKIINLSSRLSAPGSITDETIAEADRLFGLTEALTRELGTRIAEDVERIAGGLNIDIGDLNNSTKDDAAQQLLGERLGQLSQLGQMNSELWRSQTRAALEQAIRRIVFMTLNIENCLLFVADPLAETLSAHIEVFDGDEKQSATPDFTLPLLPNRSIVSDAVLQKEPLRNDSERAEQLTVIDKQLLKQCDADFLLCTPLQYEGTTVGALVLGLNHGDDDPQASKAVLLAGLCSEIAAAVNHHSQQLRNAAYADGESDAIHKKISEAVHEAGNPLSIIRNYLEMLRLKLGEEHQANADLELIKQEIDRVGAILLRLREPETTAASNGEISLNKLVSDIARIFEQSLCATHQIELELNLSDSIPPIRSNVTHLQQILTNLLKNAVEALAPNGHIALSTDSGVMVNGRLFAEITITDDGPGIPEGVMRQLFSPITSQKGGGHSGLGLSITKKLMDEIGGSIVCKSSKRGTQFRLLIPLDKSSSKNS